QHLMSGGATPEEAHLRAALSGGSVGQAVALEADAYRAQRDRLLALLEGIRAMDGFERTQQAEALADDDALEQALGTLRSLLRDVAALRLGVEDDVLQNAD